MTGKLLFGVAMFCMFVAGIAGGRSRRTWSDAVEIDRGLTTPAVLLFLLGIAFAAVGAAE